MAAAIGLPDDVTDDDGGCLMVMGGALRMEVRDGLEDMMDAVAEEADELAAAAIAAAAAFTAPSRLPPNSGTVSLVDVERNFSISEI